MLVKSHFAGYKFGHAQHMDNECLLQDNVEKLLVCSFTRVYDICKIFLLAVVTFMDMKQLDNIRMSQSDGIKRRNPYMKAWEI